MSQYLTDNQKHLIKQYSADGRSALNIAASVGASLPAVEAFTQEQKAREIALQNARAI